jgi:hypothetical protein
MIATTSKSTPNDTSLESEPFEILSASPDIRTSSPKEQHDQVRVQLTSAKQVKLDVGGYKFSTTLTTLTADPDSMLAAMFSGRFPVEKNEEGCVFIDRDGSYFHHILNWLRNGYLPPIDEERECLLIEARYYQISSLVDCLLVPPQEKYTLKELLLLINSVSSKKKVQLASADLSKLNLNGINLPAANLNFACLDDSSLQYANLSEVCLQRGSLCNANLQFADLSLANLQNCCLSHARLNNANLQGANLQGADLTNCDLQGANMQCANLQGAILQGANVQHTNLMGAKLQGASLHGITNVQHAKGLKR